MDLITAVKATYEVIGQDLSDLAIQAIVTELKAYPVPAVMQALTRCRKELRKLTLADILERIPGGHPKAEEAWALVSRVMRDERASIVWTEEMAEAYGVACRLEGDMVAARMAFKETYTNAVNRSRTEKPQPVWKMSLGYDPHGRQSAVEEAVSRGLITQEQGMKLLPSYTPTEAETTLKLMHGQGVGQAGMIAVARVERGAEKF